MVLPSSRDATLVPRTQAGLTGEHGKAPRLGDTHTEAASWLFLSPSGFPR